MENSNIMIQGLRAEFLEMPARLARLEEHMENVLKLVKQQSSEDKSGGIMAEGENT